MRAVLVVVLSMYLFAGFCLVVSYWLKADSFVARVNRYVGTSVGAFATGLLFLLCYALLFPQENRTARAMRLLNDKVSRDSARIDSLQLQFDSLLSSRRIP